MKAVIIDRRECMDCGVERFHFRDDLDPMCIQCAALENIAREVAQAIVEAEES